MDDRFFTPAEVEALIPALAETMGGVMEAHREAEALRERLRGEQQRVALSGGAVVDRQGWRTMRQRVERLKARIQAGLDQVQRLGGVPKDLTLGLVDFPHLRDGETVNLCWKHGERQIRYWHGLDEGYAARKPL
jgi:hypothetical protein